MQLLISCCKPVKIGKSSFFASNNGIATSSSATTLSINSRKMRLARIVLEISINSFGLSIPPICARRACGRTSKIPPIGTLPFKRKIDNASSISASKPCTASSSVSGANFANPSCPSEHVAKLATCSRTLSNSSVFNARSAIIQNASYLLFKNAMNCSKLHVLTIMSL